MSFFLAEKIREAYWGAVLADNPRRQMSLTSKVKAARACQRSVTQQICFHVFREQVPRPAFGVAQMVSVATIQGLHRLK